jgi:hypothetical protein
MDSTFEAITGLPGIAADYSPAEQDRAALELYAYDLRVWGDPWHAWSTRWVCGLG